MAGTYCFLFDECLSPALIGVAEALGFAAFHVKTLGRLGATDRELASLALDRDYVFVTNDRADYLKIYRQFEVHSGLVILVPNTGIDDQRRLFTIVANYLVDQAGIVNKVVEIDNDERISLVDWPPPLSNTPEI